MVRSIQLQQGDDWPVLWDRLRRVRERRVALILPWDTDLFDRVLDYELLWREAQELGKEVAVVTPDPDQRSLARHAGLSAFPTLDTAETARTWRRPPPRDLAPPRTPWWEAPIPIWPPPAPRRIPRWIRHVWQGARLTIFLVTLVTILASAVLLVPQASVALVPAGETVSVIVPVGVDQTLETSDMSAGLIPARRVGDYFEGYLEVETTGTSAFVSGRATGSVLFTNLLHQDVVVPSGTVVRTSGGSFPVRFATTHDVTIPARGQASAAIEALGEGPAGNVGVNQINQVEGTAGLAIRVTNPDPTYGGATQEVRAVSQEDMDRARGLLIDQLLGTAYTGLQEYVEPNELLLRHSLTVQGMETSYNRFLGERADTVGLHMRLLVTGLVVDRGNAHAVAYASLVRSLPAGYELIWAGYEIGEMAEEPIGAGEYTFFVIASGYASAVIDLQEVRQSVAAQPPEEAQDTLSSDFPLGSSPQVSVWPDWFPRMPLLPLRITVSVDPQG